jgi:hypothetical protein
LIVQWYISFATNLLLQLSLKRHLAHQYARIRAFQLYRAANAPVQAQSELLTELIRRGRLTDFGIAHQLQRIQRYADYQKQVPVRKYEDFLPWIDRVVAGEPNVLWPGRPLYLATTSGTTAGTKYIPISKASMPYHIAGARDVLLLYIKHTGKSGFLDGKMSFLSGSPVLSTNPAGLQTGRLSGIAHHYVPGYLMRNRVPSHATNCIDDWEVKIDQTLNEILSADLRLIAGIPPWVQMLFERLQHRTQQNPIDVWPNLSLYVQGGVDFSPYRALFMQLLGRTVDVVEVYPASEGFIALQDRPDEEGLMLLVNHGIFYEFIPLSEYGQPNARRLTVGEVELGEHYVILLTTNAGLWSYEIGDTVKFTSLYPHRIRVTGRTKHYISAFGEHVIEEEINGSMAQALASAGGIVQEFTVAPLVLPIGSCHEWWIEFKEVPPDMNDFSLQLDKALQARNSYFRNLREGNILGPVQIKILSAQACREYMRSIGKLGGQNKFVRLSNNRTIVDQLAYYLKTE